MEDKNSKKSLTIQGVVVSDAMDKTVVIEIITRKVHPRFKKIMTRTSRVKIHDEKNECQVGDRVIAVETRPLSKQKHHKLVKVIEKAKLV
ncbi:30S ribosomal protein S17 [Leptospira biflexa]|jgi:small subunit ribosomal protein S17|uniref:Small ribosomal subunit protein uS17 n=20 Tax=Leptospira TaxID=171 RepID=B0SSG8_LEPBP|nr:MULTISPECIES: 30S ribosomal protein S17 [Leptospira]PKA22125.1 30S ribosomal protein S17 [Leptospira sp. mixed culture ATI2-C-A1]ABZ94408.1 30S Ribosomal protein S17 [Leptospira biflexa serovar Patoc strain 'Patoc 1 (Ames)']ABZ98058.1 30S ribosomal protein S17 [Leptospira biflexa serovar Patoc strain 'Patoc 1 (Paris)']EMJ86601.1 30S ribosomal protein S17 [Leptospira meyeri serovar Semaranga str. Veldrot Semarang 173]EOQ88149.1 30S ribosomal protein S17 [Leptospira yanagawae serovar Saopaulo